MSRGLRILRFTPLILFLSCVVMSFIGLDVHPSLIWLTLASFIFEIGVVAVNKGLVMYVLRRVGEAIVTLWLIASLTFLLLRILPGGPFDAEKALTPEVKANIE